MILALNMRGGAREGRISDAKSRLEFTVGCSHHHIYQRLFIFVYSETKSNPQALS